MRLSWSSSLASDDDEVVVVGVSRPPLPWARASAETSSTLRAEPGRTGSIRGCDGGDDSGESGGDAPYDDDDSDEADEMSGPSWDRRQLPLTPSCVSLEAGSAAAFLVRWPLMISPRSCWKALSTSA